MSKLRLICSGGWDSQGDGDDIFGREVPSIEYARHACVRVVLGLACALLAPLVLLPSSVGSIPFQYSKEFLALPTGAEYLQLLWKNGFVVLKKVLEVDLIGETALPKPPDSGLGAFAVLVIALFDGAAIYLLTTGVLRICENFRKWNESH